MLCSSILGDYVSEDRARWLIVEEFQLSLPLLVSGRCSGTDTEEETNESEVLHLAPQASADDRDGEESVRPRLLTQNLAGVPLAEVTDMLLERWNKDVQRGALRTASSSNSVATQVLPARLEPSRFVGSNIMPCSYIQFPDHQSAARILPISVNHV